MMPQVLSDYYCELERFGLFFEYKNCQLRGWLEAYEEAGKPFGHTARAFAVWVRFSWDGRWATRN